MGAHNFESNESREAIKRLREDIKRLKIVLELQALKIRTLEQTTENPEPPPASPPENHPTLPFSE